MSSISSARYNNVAQALHWLIGLGIIFMIALGWSMMEIPRENPDRFFYFQLHKSIGITILLLSIARLAWRLTHKAPELPRNMPAWEKFAAHASHYIFYFLIIFMPFTGWVIVSTSSLGLPTMLYGIIPWPHLPLLPAMANKAQINDFMEATHGLLAWMIVGLLVLHIGAALKHHFIVKDDILTRMLPESITGFLNNLRRWV